MTEDDWLRAIAESPLDITPRLVYADWLEERGDSRAEEVRAQCRYRMPIAPEERQHLAAIAGARAEASESQVAVTVNLAAPGFTLVPDPASLFPAHNFADDMAHLSRIEIARNFPRDDKGRLQLDCAVLLARYRCTDALPRFRNLWLTAVGPHRRSDAQVITVRLELLIGDNHPHNWSSARWYWDDRDIGLDEQARWGITGKALRAVTGPEGTGTVARLKAAAQAGKLSPTDRIALCTALQDAGKFEEALQIAGVALDDELSQLLNNKLTHFARGCDHPPATAIPTRAEKLRRALLEAAPWRFAAGLAQGPDKLQRLFIFPGSKHARKPGLAIVRGEPPRLRVEFTAANTVFPETWWRRPVELDIARWGLTAR
jgi:uncharacterized protein (TIGR02996 family)